jgi:hypothetical protein
MKTDRERAVGVPCVGVVFAATFPGEWFARKGGFAVPTDPRKCQKQKERKAAKRKAKHHELTRQKSAGLPERLAAAAQYPILHCWVTDDLWEQGLGYVCLSRQLPNGHVAFAVFLVDRYCLGVKDAMMEIVPRATYDRRIMGDMLSRFSAKNMAPAAARKLVEGAVEYARTLGLQPHPDYARARPIFGDIDPAESTEQFEYGKDGKPFFVAGPHDGPARCRQILNALVQSCGVDGFHYMIPFTEPEALPEALAEQNTRIIGPDEKGTVREWDLDSFEPPAGGPEP